MKLKKKLKETQILKTNCLKKCIFNIISRKNIFYNDVINLVVIITHLKADTLSLAHSWYGSHKHP